MSHEWKDGWLTVRVPSKDEVKSLQEVERSVSNKFAKRTIQMATKVQFIIEYSQLPQLSSKSSLNDKEFAIANISHDKAYDLANWLLNLI